jgi:hypothetical protein
MFFVCGSARAQEAEKTEEAAKERFIDRGAYIEDTKTRLLWQKDGAASGKRNFSQAAEYAKELKLGGIGGWRVPSAEELRTIFPADEPPFINSAYTKEMCCGKGVEFRSYWTCELDLRADDYAYVFHWYASGGKNNCYASRNFCYVRCVHDPAAAVAAELDDAAIVRAKDLIAQLADEDFARREEATQELIKFSAPIGGLLREAEKSAADAEVLARINQILRSRGE